ncbi:MAG: multidrug ABC transporter permease/ATP-binding protein [Alicyclobacillus sp. RIFOXYA1_FULL_53_8]|nr:MAG: multidrug ABC transporter permease/ATP-binding protein [Alicyclobacillus sp. RIFOXYA1_FULL_53_8]
MRVFLDLMWYFKQHKRRYLVGIFMLVLVAFLNLIPPQVVGIIVDAVRHHTLTQGMLFRWLGLLVLTGLITYVLRYFWRLLLFGSAVGLSTVLRNRLYEHFSLLSPQFYHRHRIGDLMAHATNDIQAVEATAGEGILTLVDSVTTGSIVTLTMATTISWKLTLVALLPMPLMALATSFYGSRLHKTFKLAQEAFSKINERVQENISGVRVVKAFGQEEVEKRDFAELSQEVVEKNVAVAKIDALFDPTISLIVGISFFLSISVGAVFVVQHTDPLSIGQLTTFTMYLGQLIWPMLAFGWLFNIVERGRASNDRVRELLAIEPEIVDAPNALDVPPTGAIDYRIQSFAYPDAAAPVLQNLFFTLHPGQTLGVVGKTGSGKTTLLRLLLREFDCHDGDIQIGGNSIYHYKLQQLRQTMAYVPQDHFLFSTTIAENIAFGNTAASASDVHQAAQTASIHEDILRFPDGYKTMVGERGVTLSGGQKQRISIARALLMDADVLILDNSLSAVDAKTEVQILDALRTTRSGKTTLIASHRLSAIEHADLILVLDGGHVIERGTHADLMARDGWYALMYQRQQLESLVEEGGVIA